MGSILKERTMTRTLSGIGNVETTAGSYSVNDITANTGTITTLGTTTLNATNVNATSLNAPSLTTTSGGLRLNFNGLAGNPIKLIWTQQVTFSNISSGGTTNAVLTGGAGDGTITSPSFINQDVFTDTGLGAAISNYRGVKFTWTFPQSISSQRYTIQVTPGGNDVVTSSNMWTASIAGHNSLGCTVYVTTPRSNPLSIETYPDDPLVVNLLLIYTGL